MTYRDTALELIRERSAHPVGSLDWQYLTRSARSYVRMALKIPVENWK